MLQLLLFGCLAVWAVVSLARAIRDARDSRRYLTSPDSQLALEPGQLEAAIMELIEQGRVLQSSLEGPERAILRGTLVDRELRNVMIQMNTEVDAWLGNVATAVREVHSDMSRGISPHLRKIEGAMKGGDWGIEESRSAASIATRIRAVIDELAQLEETLLSWNDPYRS